MGILFYNVDNLKISSLTLKDPVNFAVTLDKVSNFTVSDITFDMNNGNPYQANMDGIHINGNCHHGRLERLYGTCYDDIVALNADEGSHGPISDITIKGIDTDKSYSAVRMLSATPECVISNIRISDVKGTFYHFCIAFMHFYETGKRGRMEDIVIENICAAKSDRNLINHPRVHQYPKYGVIDMSSDLDIKDVRISNLYRREFTDVTVPAVKIAKNTTLQNIILENIRAENCQNTEDMPLVVNESGCAQLIFNRCC